MFGKFLKGGSSNQPDYADLGKQAAAGDQRAVKAILDGASSGNADAQLEAGILYVRGTCVEQNDEAAAEWYEKAAAQGLLNAQFNLGCMHYAGQGFERSIRNALHWFEAASKGGHARARQNVPIMRLQAGVIEEEQMMYVANGINKVAGNIDKVLAQGYVAKLKKLTRSPNVRKALLLHKGGMDVPISVGVITQKCMILVRNISSATPLMINVVLDCAIYDAWEALDMKLAEPE